MGHGQQCKPLCSCKSLPRTVLVQSQSVTFVCVCVCVCVSCWLQTLQSNVGLNVAQAKTESVGIREIENLIEKDVPQVSTTTAWGIITKVLQCTITYIGRLCVMCMVVFMCFVVVGICCIPRLTI